MSADASAWIAPVAAASEAVPSEFLGSRMDPKWYCASAARVPDPAMLAVGADQEQLPDLLRERELAVDLRHARAGG